MKRLVGMILAMALSFGVLAGCKSYDGPALSGEEMSEATEPISFSISKVEETDRADVRVYTILLENGSKYPLEKVSVTMVYQVLILEKQVEYSGGELYPKENPFSMEAGEKKELTIEVAVYDPDSLEGEQCLIKVQGYVDNEQPKNQFMKSELIQMEEK